MKEIKTPKGKMDVKVPKGEFDPGTQIKKSRSGTTATPEGIIKNILSD